MRFLSLGSGSKGNATLIEAGATRLLIDCGFARGEFARRMAERDLDPATISAILVTHEHGDHAGGVGAVARHWDIPVYLTHGTSATGRTGDLPVSAVIQPGRRFVVGEIDVDPIAVPHDAREPVQFVFRSSGQVLGVLTDLGSVTPHVINAYRGCHALLLEFNHCSRMLASGPYPQALKRRVGGAWGHLNNHQAAELLVATDTTQLQTLVVGHISEQNNTTELAAESLRVWGDRDAVHVIYAAQGTGFDWLECCRRDAPAGLQSVSGLN